MTKQIEEAGVPLNLEAVEKQAAEDVIAQREEALAKQLEEMKRRKRKLVDPLQFEMSIQAEDLSSYVPSFGWELAPPSDSQVKTLEKLGILPEAIGTFGKDLSNASYDCIEREYQLSNQGFWWQTKPPEGSARYVQWSDWVWKNDGEKQMFNKWIDRQFGSKNEQVQAIRKSI